MKQRPARASARTQVCISHLADQALEVFLTIGLLHDPERRVPRDNLREYVPALDIRRRKLVAPPLMRGLIGHERKWKIYCLRTSLCVEEGKTLPQPRY